MCFHVKIYSAFLFIWACYLKVFDCGESEVGLSAAAVSKITIGEKQE